MLIQGEQVINLVIGLREDRRDAIYLGTGISGKSQCNFTLEHAGHFWNLITLINHPEDDLA